jgi:hypothetical protein
VVGGVGAGLAPDRASLDATPHERHPLSRPGPPHEEGGCADTGGRYEYTDIVAGRQAPSLTREEIASVARECEVDLRWTCFGPGKPGDEGTASGER